jgi:hypothetical protein
MKKPPIKEALRPGQAAVSPLVPAIDRLDAAIARLETAVDTHAKRTAQDRQTLNAALEDLRSDHATLQAEARTIGARLDAVIERLRSVAEGA